MLFLHLVNLEELASQTAVVGVGFDESVFNESDVILNDLHLRAALSHLELVVLLYLIALVCNLLELRNTSSQIAVNFGCKSTQSFIALGLKVEHVSLLNYARTLVCFTVSLNVNYIAT
jgi:hypothetical protein